MLERERVKECEEQFLNLVDVFVFRISSQPLNYIEDNIGSIEGVASKMQLQSTLRGLKEIRKVQQMVVERRMELESFNTWTTVLIQYN